MHLADAHAPSQVITLCSQREYNKGSAILALAFPCSAYFRIEDWDFAD